MKRLLLILSLVANAIACNNSSNTTPQTTADTLTNESPLMDAINTADSAVKEIKKVSDTGFKKIEEEIHH